jgi:hypothetical protein
MLESVVAGKVLPEGSFKNGETWSDGTAGGIEDGSETLLACIDAARGEDAVAKAVEDARAALAGKEGGAGGVFPAGRPLVDGILTCDEKEIEEGMLFMLSKHHKVRTHRVFVASKASSPILRTLQRATNFHSLAPFALFFLLSFPLL